MSTKKIALLAVLAAALAWAAGVIPTPSLPLTPQGRDGYVEGDELAPRRQGFVNRGSTSYSYGDHGDRGGGGWFSGSSDRAPSPKYHR